MTPPTGRADLTIDTESLHSLLRLALGRAPTEQGLDWGALFACAERERLVSVIWQRSAESIRRDAPAAISAVWQKRAILSGLVVDQQLDVLATAIATLRKHGVSPVVLKGIPLAQRIYGDCTVRPVLDADLYIPEDERGDATSALTSIGWRCTSGCAPEEERFERIVGPHIFVLEVHSSALDDRLLDHVHFPVEQQLTHVGRFDLPAHSGRFVPAFLATHLAKHHEKPLLWAVDFFLLWGSLAEPDRRDAIAAAREAGLGRHLAWAIDLALNVAACDLDLPHAEPAMRRLVSSLAVTGDTRRLIRLVSLSESPAAALRVIAGRVWPLAWRKGWRNAPDYFLRRGVAWLYRHLVFEKPSAPPAEAHGSAIALTADDCEQRLVAALESGSAAWVSPVDGSMEPAIPRYGTARIVPVNGHGVRRGDVVVTSDANGRCALRRVTSLGTDTVRLRPDTRRKAEEVTPYSAIVGLCDVVAVSGTRMPIEQRPHGTLSMLRAVLRGAKATKQPPSRLMYVYDFESTRSSSQDTSVRFEELTRDEIRERAASLIAGGAALPAPNGGDMGCVVGTLSGRQVYHVWYVRGDGTRLHDLPAGWRPRGSVLFLHGGYTEPEFRGRGIHCAALRWLLARELDSGTAHAIGVVNADNVPALRAVESVGFRAVGRVT
jgi:GNAT superfamily N-acetyltransferase